MLKDDRMMGMLTFVVILIAFGTLLQRMEVVKRFLGLESTPIELRTDEAMVRAEQLVAIDVLANDTGLADDAAERLVLLERPGCGRAIVRGDQVEYLAGRECAGAVAFRYGLTGLDQTAEIRVTVGIGDPTQDAVAAVRDETAPDAPAPPSPADAPAAPSAAPASGNAAGTGTGETGEGRNGPDAGEGGTTLARAEPGADAEVRDTAPQAGADSASASDETVASGNRDTAAAGGGGAPAPASGSADAAATRPARNRNANSGEATAGGGSGDASQATAGTGAGRHPTPVECIVPPTITLDTGPAAVTRVTIDSPCHRGTVAELSYDELRFAVPLDGEGRGSLAAPGFRPSSTARLVFADGRRTGFEIAFREVDRIDRVAVVWDTPVDLSLHAFEFGALPGTAGHVRPGHTRSFEAVRRDGGGWLATYEAAGDVGQNVAVYTFWRRYGGPSGVVKLALDPGLRGGAGGATCRQGTAGPADFKVLRSTGGRPERPKLRRLAPFDCTEIAGGGAMIGDAVDDLIIRRR